MQMLTPKEQKLFEFIEQYQMTHGASPTVREMREHMKLKSDGFIVHCLKSLREKGAIEKDDTPRGIKLLPSVSQKLHSETVKIPVLGHIPAGSAVLSEQQTDEWMTFEEGQIPHPQDCFILRVRGDSMIDAGIFEGDYVISSTKKRPKTGDIVVALVDGGSTVKRYITEKGMPVLKAENIAYKNIYPESELQIQGVVVGLFRKY